MSSAALTASWRQYQLGRNMQLHTQWTSSIDRNVWKVKLFVFQKFENNKRGQSINGSHAMPRKS